MYHIRHYSPDGKFRTGEVDVDGREPGRLRHQPDLVKCLFKAPYQHFTIEGGNDHLSIDCLYGAIHDHHVAIEDTGPGHGITADPHEKSSGLIPHELLIEIDAS